MEENKKKGGIGVSYKTKPVAEAATTSKATNKPTASGLLAVKAEEKRKMERKVETKVTTVKSVQMDNTSTVRCSTTDEELEALFQQLIGKFLMILKLLLNLLDVLDDNPEASEEMQEELEVIKSNIYLQPEDDYEMDVADDKEDEAMKEMLALIENAKG